MAQASVDIIRLLRNTAERLRNSAHYQWGHMGLCNCGFLAQEVTKLKKEDIHRRAMTRYGDWNDQLNDYCPASGLPMDDLISDLLSAGFDIDDLKHLERLSSPDILSLINGRHLVQNRQQDVVLYLETWAELIEHKLLESITISSADLAREGVITEV